jgi:hypothetical protein
MIPRPMREVDYLIIGAVGTFACLVVIFGTMARDFATLGRRRSILPLETGRVDSTRD